MKSIFLMQVLFLMAACSSVQTYSDADKSADFYKYHSYAWLQRSDSVQDIFYSNELIEKNIKYYTDQEMTARGYVQDSYNPDLLLEYHTMLEKKQQTVSNPVYSTPSYPYSPYYGAYGYNPAFPYSYYNTPYLIGYNTQQIEYNEGTLVVDVIDRRKNQLIWRGWSVGTVNDEQSLEKELPKDIKKIFKKYPIPSPKKK
jgi:hypothetical protein